MTMLALNCSRNGAIPIRAMPSTHSRRNGKFFVLRRMVPLPRMKYANTQTVATA